MTICIATIWHGDRTEGLEYYKQKDIKTYTTNLTDQLSKKNGKKRAEFLMAKILYSTLEDIPLKLITQVREIQLTTLSFDLKMKKYYKVVVKLRMPKMKA